MSRTILFTGFPGFIGRRLVARLVDEGAEVICLVEERMRERAAAAAEEITRRAGAPARLSLQSGDISLPGLGLDASLHRALAERVTEVWHLAAVYDLAVDAATARRVNVEGTRHVLAFCAEANRPRLVYFSTCYVSGDRGGTIREDELAVGQGFKNNYEASKFAAEVEVRLAMERGQRATILRPAIVVGDSSSGETDRFDGPYVFFRFLERARRARFLPQLGQGSAEVNLVPVDFVVAATLAIVAREESEGATVHLADPAPLSAAQLYDLACKEATGRRPLRLRVPGRVVGGLLERPAVARALGVPAEAWAYFEHEAHHDTRVAARLLEGSGVRCPDLAETLPVLYRYFREHQVQS